MGLVARILLIIPSLIAGWFVSREDPRFWVAALAVGLVLMATLCIVGLYVRRSRRNVSAD